MRFQMVRWSFVAFFVAALAVGIAATTMGGDLGWIALQLLVAAAFMLSACVSGPASSRLAAVERAVATALFIYALHVISTITDAGFDAALKAPLESTYLRVVLAALVVVPLFQRSLPMVTTGEVARLAKNLGAKLAFAVLITLVLRWGDADPSLANLRAFFAAAVFFMLYHSLTARVPVIGRVSADQIAPVILIAACLFDPTTQHWQTELGIMVAMGLFALIRRMWPVRR